MIKVVHNKQARKARIETSDSDIPQWYEVTQLLANFDLDDCDQGADFLEIPWWWFSQQYKQLKELIEWKQWEEQFEFTEAVKAYLKEEKQQNSHREKLTRHKINRRLKQEGFERTLKSYQLRNVTKLVNLPSGGATFSVPGAGKTTEAIACFFLRRKKNTRLFVICPKNAFAVWEKEFNSCAPNLRLNIVRLRGSRREIIKLLNTKATVFLCGYQKFTNEIGVMGSILESNDMIFLDESHYIKRLSGGKRAEAIISVQHLVDYKLIMSGTPLPNTSDDLISQYKFLNSGLEINPAAPDFSETIKRFYVRTTKRELMIPPYKVERVMVPLVGAQLTLYGSLVSEASRRLLFARPTDRNRLTAFSKSWVRLLQVVSNPQLLVGSGLENSSILKDSLAEGAGSKLLVACELARRLADSGRKCIIWTNFVQNVETVSAALADLGADFIHGGVEAGSDEEDDTRERKIKDFHNDSEKMVLVANPAACAEAISLHTICHDAIYIDRNFNAAQYLQSVDRIHRLGLKRGTKTTVRILHSPGTIDEVVDSRLDAKMRNMEDVLNDSSIRSEVIDGSLDDNEIFSEEDLNAFRDYLANQAD